MNQIFTGNNEIIYYNDAIMSAMASQIIGVSNVCSTFCSVVNQRKHPISASLTFVRGIHRSPVDSPHKGTVTRKTFPFNNVIIADDIHPKTGYEWQVQLRETLLWNILPEVYCNFELIAHTSELFHFLCLRTHGGCNRSDLPYKS